MMQKNALTEALMQINDQYEDVFDSVAEICFVIYIGSEFEAKEYLLNSAKNIIREYLKNVLDDNIGIKVGIALSSELSGGGDLRLYVLS